MPGVKLQPMSKLIFFVLAAASMITSCERSELRKSSGKQSDNYEEINRTELGRFGSEACIAHQWPPRPDTASKELWAMHDHYVLCDQSSERTIAILSLLSDRGDAKAKYYLAARRISDGDMQAAEPLILQSARLGYEPAKQAVTRKKTGGNY